MSKTHEEFMAYVSGVSLQTVENDDDYKLKVVIEICDKLKQDFKHLADHLKGDDHNRYLIPGLLGLPIFDNCTDFFHHQYGGTEKDDDVLYAIQSLTQNCDLSTLFLAWDDRVDASFVTILNYDNIMKMHVLGYKVYINARVIDGEEGIEPLPAVYVDIGDLLIEL